MYAYLEPCWEERNKRKMFTFLKQNIIADDSLCPNRNTWKWAKKTGSLPNNTIMGSIG